MSLNKEKSISIERRKKLYELIERLKIDTIYVQSIKYNETNKLKIIDEALTHTSANSLINHERLEFLGDAVLRLAATEFIERTYSSLSVGERSELRSQLVSDQWLHEVGQDISIEKTLLLGPKAAKDKSALATFQAETTEALIGALFECFNDLQPIHQWLGIYWTKESKKVMADPHKNNPKSALQEWSQAKGMLLPNYETNELSHVHGNPKRFFCKVQVSGKSIAEGWGRSIKEAEKAAAKEALKNLKNFC
ncbi:ribonuclease III family protein [Prochlorococcus sp. MIT 1223]|uniref:ribonuclease III family protein n=1 Tax=Prochlorococcus sp. MIT 1223 TaxID=3096217 RepID=UPI002A75E6B6|nr:putative dsRNA-binding protein [Prochlorococcus sp. MIT 1223]